VKKRAGERRADDRLKTNVRTISQRAASVNRGFRGPELMLHRGTLDAGHHLRVGEALAPLVAEGVLVLASGHMTHNLREWIADARRRGSMSADEREPEAYVREFTAWVDDALRRDDRSGLARWADAAPHALHAHPTPEHFLPLMIAVGAAGRSPRVERIEAGVDSGVLAMDAYLFWPKT